MAECTQAEVDKAVARTRKIASWVRDNADREEAKEVVKYYTMLSKCPEGMALVCLEAALEKVEALQTRQDRKDD